LRSLCNSLGLDITDKDLGDLVRLMDRDGSGSIDFKEFVAVMAAQFYNPPSESDMRTAFDFFDKDGSGTITADELLAAMSKFKKTVTKQEVQRMISTIDKDRDGRINFRGLLLQRFFISFSNSATSLLIHSMKISRRVILTEEEKLCQ
jgi:calmodulin